MGLFGNGNSLVNYKSNNGNNYGYAPNYGNISGGPNYGIMTAAPNFYDPYTPVNPFSPTWNP